MALPTYMQYTQSAMGRQEDGTLRPALGQNPNPPDNRGWLEKAAGDVWNTVTAPARSVAGLFNPPRQITDDAGKPLSDYSPAMNSPGGQDLNKSASTQMAPINDRVWEMVNANNPNSQFVLDEQRKRYAALTDPNNPELRRAASLAGESAMAAARRSGIRGGYGIQAGEGAFNKAYQDQYLQRQQMAQQPLHAISAQSEADRNFVFRGVEMLAGNKLREMGIDMERFKLLLEDERYRTELKLAMEQRDWDKVMQIINTGLRVGGMLAGGGVGPADPKNAGF